MIISLSPMHGCNYEYALDKSNPPPHFPLRHKPFFSVSTIFHIDLFPWIYSVLFWSKRFYDIISYMKESKIWYPHLLKCAGGWKWDWCNQSSTLPQIISWGNLEVVFTPERYNLTYVHRTADNTIVAKF